MKIHFFLLLAWCLVFVSCSSGEEFSSVKESTALVEEKALPVEFPSYPDSYQGLILDAEDEQVGSVLMSIGGGYSYISGNAILVPLEEGYFYEGWLVRSEPLDVVSTGELEQVEFEDGILDFRNNLELEGDFSEHAKYIITLEPDDGDPAPAAHVAEASLELLSR